MGERLSNAHSLVEFKSKATQHSFYIIYNFITRWYEVMDRRALGNDDDDDDDNSDDCTVAFGTRWTCRTKYYTQYVLMALAHTINKVNLIKHTQCGEHLLADAAVEIRVYHSFYISVARTCLCGFGSDAMRPGTPV